MINIAFFGKLWKAMSEEEKALIKKYLEQKAKYDAYSENK